RPPGAMTSDEPSESSEGLIGFARTRKDRSDVRIEGDDDAAFRVPGGVRVRSGPAEVVLGKDFVQRDALDWRLLTLWLPHTLFSLCLPHPLFSRGALLWGR